MFESSYDHTQKAPWYLLLFAFAALFFTVAWVTRAEPVGPAFLVVAGLLMAMAGYSFQHLTVCDEGDRLAICFGPLPLFQRRIPYDDMTGVEIGRTTIMDGWGIHWSPWGGWVVEPVCGKVRGHSATTRRHQGRDRRCRATGCIPEDSNTRLKDEHYPHRTISPLQGQGIHCDWCCTPHRDRGGVGRLPEGI